MSEASPPDDDDADDDLGDMRDLLRKVAAAPSIDPTTLSGGRTPDIQGFRPGERLGHFRIVERIGAGGMGVVYRAEDERLRRSVALKVLPPHQVFDRERRRRMWREAQSAAAVNHPNIAAIYELGEDATGTVFIAMEYLGGRALRRSYQDAPVPPREALGFAVQIAQGLARAHAAGIVHRDLKPDNVMVLSDGAVKILDFGLAKLLAGPEEQVPSTPSSGEEGSAATKDGQIVGTPRYMSPEQKSGALVDARADIYAFGVLLFELLTGVWPEPFARELPALTRTAEPARARAGAWSSLFDELLHLSARCVRQAPAERFADGAELLEALRRLQQRFDPARGGPWRFLRPARLLQAVAVLAVIGVAVLGVLRSRAPLPVSAADLDGPSGPRVFERRLTANPPGNPVLDAALSPSGGALAWVDRGGLFVRTLEPPSTDRIPFTEKLALASVAWLGADLLVSGHTEGRDGAELWRVTPEGKATFLARGLFERPRPSPDGTQLAWIEPKGIAVGPLTSARENGRILVEARGAQVHQVAWSPDGRRLAYLRVRATEAGVEARLESVPTGGGEPLLLLSNPRLIQEHGGGAVAWAPDGRLIFALAERPPRETGFTLWALPVDAAGRAPEHPRMLHSWSGSTPGLLTAAGGTLAYARTETQSDAYVAELADGGRRLQHPRRVTLSDRNEHPTGWTADSSALVFTSDQDGGDDLFALVLGTGSTRRLVGTRAAETWGTFVGERLLFWEHPPPSESGPHRARLMSVLGDEERKELLRTRMGCDHTGGELPPTRAQFRCTDTGECVLGEALGGELVFTRFRADAEPGRGEELTRVQNPGRAGTGWDLSRDGQRLALPGAAGQVKVLELQSGRSTDRYLQHGCELEQVAFAPDGRGMYATAVCAGDRPYKLLFAEPNRSTQVLWDSSSTRFGFPKVSPDGRHLTFAVRPHDNDVWLASGF